jgi:2-polyprenyl-3-methyl-5-hydroxy-6-metoxy-1,4-benzoquinol methylase/tetratricopeptide (TPR) repeat protein/glycosyltransferase involved in cell wall biosynthesis
MFTSALREQRSCENCQAAVAQTMHSLGRSYQWIGRYIMPEDMKEARRWADSFEKNEFQNACYQNWAIGEWVRSSIYTWFRSAVIDLENPQVEHVYREHLYSGLIAGIGVKRLIEDYQPDVMFQFNGRMAPTRIAIEIAREHGIRFICHERGWLRESLSFYENSSCQNSNSLAEFWQDWKDTPLLPGELETITEYMTGRQYGKAMSWHSFSPPPQEADALHRNLRLHADRPVWALFTSSEDEMVGSDALKLAFTTQIEWIEYVIAYVKKHPEIDLVIRVHPNTGGKKTFADNVNQLEQFQQLSRQLPPNVRMVMPDDAISTYTLMDIATLGLVYMSTTGLEMACKGKTAIAIAGWFANKPFTQTPQSFGEHYAILDEARALPLGFTSQETRRLAYRYAYILYYRWNISFPLVEMVDTYTPKLRYQNTGELAPGKEPNLDRICRIILDGEPVVLPPAEDDLRDRSEEQEKAWFEERPQTTDHRLQTADGESGIEDQGSTLPHSHTPTLPHSPPSSVVWSGPFLEQGDDADDARSLTLGLESLGLPVKIEPVKLTGQRAELDEPQLEKLEQMHLAPLAERFVHVMHLAPAFYQKVPGAVTNIGRANFGTDRLPIEWAPHCNEMDEIWVPSDFNIDSFAFSGVDRKRLHKIPLCIDTRQFGEHVPPVRMPKELGFWFLTVIDWHYASGWDVLLRAYMEEFSADDDLGLMLQLMLPADVTPQDVAEEIRKFLKDDLKVSSPHASLDISIDPLRPGLYRAADAFILPSRGESLSLHCLEALASGLPVIATGWGGHTEFMNSENSWPIDYQMTDVPDEVVAEIPFLTGSRWAEPDAQHLRSLIRHAFENREETAQKGKAAAAHAAENFSQEKIARLVKARLDLRGEKGEEATSSQHSNTPTLQHSTPQTAASTRPAPSSSSSSPPSSSPRTRILVGHAGFPAIFCESLKSVEIHEALSFGEHEEADIPYKWETDTFQDILNRLPEGWEPDFILWVCSYYPIPEGIEHSPYPTVAAIADWNLIWTSLRVNLKRFDWIVTDKAGVDLYRRAGYTNVDYWPLFCQHAFHHHRMEGMERIYDITLVGNLNHDVQRERSIWLYRLARLKSRFDVRILAEVYNQDYALLLNQSKIVFNRSIRGEMNMRAYEAPACGALMFYEEENLEVRDFLQDRVECVLYNEDNLEDLLEYYLTHDEERERIAEAGWKRIQQENIAHHIDRLACLLKERGVLEPGERHRPFSNLPEADRLYRNVRQAFEKPTFYVSFLKKTEALFQTLLEKDPENPEVHNAYGVFNGHYGNKWEDEHEKKKMFNKAIKAFDNSLRYAPDDILPLYNLGMLYLLDGAVKQAEALFQVVVQNIDKGQAMHCIDLLLPWQYDSLRVEWERLSAECADNPEAMKAGYSQLILAEACKILGHISRHQNHPEEAARWYPRAIEASPALAGPVHRQLGDIFQQLGQPEKALEQYRHSHKKIPFDAETWKSLAEALTKTERTREAHDFHQELATVIAACPSCEPTLEWLGKELTANNHSNTPTLQHSTSQTDASTKPASTPSAPPSFAECQNVLEVREPQQLDGLHETHDGIHLDHVIERLSGPEVIALIERCCQSLQPGGLLLIQTANWAYGEVFGQHFWKDENNFRPWPTELLQHLLEEFGLEVLDHQPSTISSSLILGRIPDSGFQIPDSGDPGSVRQRFSLYHSDEHKEGLKQYLSAYADAFKGCERVLDIGCGPGIFLELLKEREISALGIDSDPEMVEKCRYRNLDAEAMDARDLPDYHEEFDGIHLGYLIENLKGDDFIKVIEKCATALRPNGQIVIRTLNWKNQDVREAGFWMDPMRVRPYPLVLLNEILKDLNFEVVSYGKESSGLEDLFIVGRKKPNPAEGQDDQTMNQKYSLYHAEGKEESMKQWMAPYADAFKGCENVLDIGCGPGIFLELLKERGISCLGFDYDPLMVQKCHEKDLSAQVADARTLSEHKEEFGGVHLGHVVEHMDGPTMVNLLGQCMNAMRPGGILIIRTPNWNNQDVHLEGFWMDHTHVRPYPPERLIEILTRLGMEITHAGHEPGGWEDTFIIAKKKGERREEGGEGKATNTPTLQHSTPETAVAGETERSASLSPLPSPLSPRILVGTGSFKIFQDNLKDVAAVYDVLSIGVEGADIEYQWERDSFADLLEQLPQGWEPDVVLWLCHYNPIPQGIEDSPFPTVAVVGDWNLLWTSFQDDLKRFDWIVSDKAGVEVIRRAGHTNVDYWPMFCYETLTHRRIDGLERIYDVTIVGNLNHDIQRKRSHYLRRISALNDRYTVRIFTGVWGEEYNRVLSQSKIVFNQSIRGEMNMRAYEATACGALLFFEEENLEIRDFFQDRVECVLYNDGNLEELIEYYLTHDEERERIAEAGYQRVQQETQRHHFERLVTLLKEKNVIPAAVVAPALRDGDKKPAAERRDHGRAFRDLPEPLRLFRQARQAFEKQNPDNENLQTAEKLLIQVLDHDPAHIETYNALGVLNGYYSQLVQDESTKNELFSKAEQSFAGGLKYAPNDALLLYNLGVLHVISGRADLAEATFNQAIQNIEQDQPLQCRELILPRTFNTFFVEWERIAAEFVDDPAAADNARRKLLLRQCCDWLGDIAAFQEQPSTAIELYQRAIDARPDLAGRPRHKLGSLLHQLEQTEEAIKQYRHAYAEEPFNTQLWKDLAAILRETGRTEEAESLHQELLTIIEACPAYEGAAEWLRDTR